MKFKNLLVAGAILLGCLMPASPAAAAQASNAFDAMQALASRTLVPEVNNQPDIYGGIWYDNKAQQFVVQYVTDQPSAPADAGKFSVRYQKVAHSKAEIDSAFASFAESAMPSAGKNWTSAFPDVVNNQIKVTTANPAAYATEAASSDLFNIAYQAPQTKAAGDACTSRYACDPFRGGIELGDSNENPICTLGYIGTNSTNQLRAISAGHCDSRTWYNFNDEVGYTTAIYSHSFDTNGTDAQKIVMEGTLTTETPHDDVYKNGSLKDADVYGWETANSIWVGENVKTSGICPIGGDVGPAKDGTIEGGEGFHTWTANDNFKVMTDWLVGYDSTACHGDSGGPVAIYNGSGGASIVGIHNSADNGDGYEYFTVTSRLISVTSVTPCTTDACGQ